MSAALLLASVAHAALLGAAGAAGVGSGWGGMGTPSAAKPAAPVRPLKPSCEGDALLAAAPRVLLCASPFTEDARTCLREVDVALRSEQLGCHIDDLPSVAFELTPIRPEQIRQIDPEPLLETLTEEKQRQFEEEQQKKIEQQIAVAVAQQVRPPSLGEQIVEAARPDVEIAPDQTRFVSDYNQKVDRQTVARGSVREEIARRSQAEQLAVKPDPQEASTEREPDDQAPSDRPEAPPVPGKLSMRAPGVATPSELEADAARRGVTTGADQVAADGLRARRGDGLIDQREVRPDPDRGEGGAGGGGAPLVDLRPSREVLERAAGGGSVDHLADVEEGDETALNTRQWVHASFFNRMKRRVRQTWDPVSVWRQNDPTGAVYGLRTRVTRVRVSLTPTGALARVIVVAPSGVELLDDEAVRAFQAAAPFPHPPGALVGDDGLITFDFGFHLEVDGGRTSWKIFRP